MDVVTHSAVINVYVLMATDWRPIDAPVKVYTTPVHYLATVWHFDANFPTFIYRVLPCTSIC